jgi:protease PrsW
MGIILSLFFGFAPMLVFAYFIYWLDRYEKEPKLLLGGVFLWGAVVAAGGAFIINTVLGLGMYVFTGDEFITEMTTGSIIAPFVEEGLKGLAVLLVFLAFRHEFDSILDGFVYAAMVALGFAATENAYYIYTYGWLEGGYTGMLFLVFVRVVLVGWQHPFYTAFIGIALAVTRLSRHTIVKLIAPLVGFSLAVFAHAFHNTLAGLSSGVGGLIFGTALDWMGWFFMLLVVLWAVWREGVYIRDLLREEVALGLITPAQYQTACSSWSQSGARLGAIRNGRYLQTNHFYQLCAELAHKKRQRATLGEEGGNSAIIERLRGELSALSPHI